MPPGEEGDHREGREELAKELRGEVWNQVGSGGAPIDVMLGTLGDHGGVVETVALRVESLALEAGSDGLAVTRLGRSSSVVCDMLGRVVQEITTDPDGIGGKRLR